MAVDTRNKRSSAIHIMSPWRTQLPTPSGTIGAAARAQVALVYAGFYVTPPATSTYFGQRHKIMRTLSQGQQ